MPKPSRREVDAAAWDVFARNEPYYHILSHPSMLSPGPAEQQEFWASGERDIASLQAFAGLGSQEGTGVDLGCGLGRLTRPLHGLTSHQIGLDISAEMLSQAREANRAFPGIEFRQICEDNWPIETGSCVLIISLLVLQHMSTLNLMERSVREMGRILRPGGKAVFNVPTIRWRGQVIQWIKNSWTEISGQREDEHLEALEARLVQAKGLRAFTDQEIMRDMLKLDCRRMKSLPILRLRSAAKSGGLKLYRMQRGPCGSTLVAAEKHE
jgi:SAM-dependent methyltransferase